MDKWICNLFGSIGDEDGIKWTPVKAPNRFWRFMQFICFGNKWRKEKTND